MLVAPCIAIPIIPRNDEGHAVDLTAREPDFMSMFRKARRVATPRNIDTVRNVFSALSKRSDDPELFQREFEDFELAVREFDDLAVREPLFGSLWKKIKHFVTIKNIKSGIELAKSLKGRELSPELEALEAREPIVDAPLKTAKEPTPSENGGAAPKHASSVAGGDNPDMYERDLEELDARDFFKSFWRKAKPVATRENIKGVSDLVRSFTREEHGDIFERDYEIDELD